MSSTPNLNLPYILPGQAQKHVTHNDAIAALDALVQLTVEDRTQTAPPGAPADGDRHIVASGGEAAWSGEDGQVAAWQDGAWRFHTPQAGWRVWVKDEARLIVFDGAAWVDAGGGSTATAPQFGVNTGADETNRLAVASDAVLFTHNGDDHRLVLNKAADGDTASLIFQSGFSGRAEIGLAGDNRFCVNTSPNGTTWTTALELDADGAANLAGPLTAAGFFRRTQQAVGPQGPFITDGVSQISSNMYAFAEPVARAGRLTRIRCHAAAPGDVPFRRYGRNGDALEQVGADILLSVVPGLNDFSVSVPVEAGEYLGFAHPSTTPLTFKAGVPGAAWVAGSSLATVNTMHALNVAFEIEASAAVGSLPQSVRDDDTSITASDAAAHLLHKSTSPHVWTLEAVGGPVGAPPTVLVNSANAGDVTIDPAPGVTLIRGDGVPGTGPRVLHASSVATLLCVGPDMWILAGAFA